MQTAFAGFSIVLRISCMIGSKNKVRITRENLLKEGYTLEQLDEVHAPIGIPLGGQLPEEIAVSIMAEIIKVKISIIPHTVMKSRDRQFWKVGHGVMVTIAENPALLQEE